MIKFLGYALDVGIFLVILSLLLYLVFKIYDTSYFKGKRGEKRLRSFLKNAPFRATSKSIICI